MSEAAEQDLIRRYLRLGLDLGRHIDGFVDAYYGPAELRLQAAEEPPAGPATLADTARRLLGDLAVDRELDPNRRGWIAAQVRGLHTTARKLAGQAIGYLDEIEACYGVRPTYLDEETIEGAHRRLDAALPGKGALAERYTTWREAQAVPADRLEAVVRSLAEDFRERTGRIFGLPEGEEVEFAFTTDRPWSGFNYYLGGLRSQVEINTDLPVLSLSVGHLVAHEAYPGHHTEHCRKEAGLVRRLNRQEESIFLVGTPQCLLAEGLADLGLEVIAGPQPNEVVASHLRPLGIAYDSDLARELDEVSQTIGAVRGNAAILLHDEGRSVDEAVAYIERWSLTTRARAAKAVEFLVDPTWRAYPFCYIDGYRICRNFVAGDPARFEKLITEQLLPSQLVGAAATP